MSELTVLDWISLAATAFAVAIVTWRYVAAVSPGGGAGARRRKLLFEAAS